MRLKQEIQSLKRIAVIFGCLLCIVSISALFMLCISHSFYRLVRCGWKTTPAEFVSANPSDEYWLRINQRTGRTLGSIRSDPPLTIRYTVDGREYRQAYQVSIAGFEAPRPDASSDAISKYRQVYQREYPDMMYDPKNPGDSFPGSDSAALRNKFLIAVAVGGFGALMIWTFGKGAWSRSS